MPLYHITKQQFRQQIESSEFQRSLEAYKSKYKAVAPASLLLNEYEACLGKVYNKWRESPLLIEELKKLGRILGAMYSHCEPPAANLLQYLANSGVKIKPSASLSFEPFTKMSNFINTLLTHEQAEMTQPFYIRLAEIKQLVVKRGHLPEPLSSLVSQAIAITENYGSEELEKFIEKTFLSSITFLEDEELSFGCEIIAYLNGLPKKTLKKIDYPFNVNLPAERIINNNIPVSDDNQFQKLQKKMQECLDQGNQNNFTQKDDRNNFTNKGDALPLSPRVLNNAPREAPQSPPVVIVDSVVNEPSSSQGPTESDIKTVGSGNILLVSGRENSQCGVSSLSLLANLSLDSKSSSTSPSPFSKV